jgi:hypothetical protein
MKNLPIPRPAAPASGWVLSLTGTLLTLLLVLGALFSRSFDASQILFSSDGPLGANAAQFAAVPQAYSGMWQDLYWVGGRAGSAFPSLTYALLWLLKPFGFAKFYTPISLLVLGLSVWLFFRQLGFRHVVCLFGALAAALNTDFFSYACWGLGTLPLAVASMFVALAALVTPASERFWLKAALAGLAVGMAVMEGFDSGAILSLYIAVFTLFQCIQAGWVDAWNWVRGLGRVVLVAGMAAFIAAQALTVLVGTQIRGVVGMQQDTRTRTQRWDEATRWSLPKVETLRVIVPGLFGYRMDTPNGGNYWGAVGQAPGVIQSRHSGSGVYGGVLVVVLAFWAVLQSFRGNGGVFGPGERRMIWFWSIALLVSLLLAWGRHAPFYKLVYALPYFSTMRNPIKFMHPFHVALVILFGYGLQAFWQRYVGQAMARAGSFSERLRGWWSVAPLFDRRWTVGMLAVVGASLLAWLLYAASRNDLEAFLKQAVAPPELAPQIAGFSLGELGWFVLFLVVTVGLLILSLSGMFAGPRARWAGVCLGLLLGADFTRANVPWVFYWDFTEKYKDNPIVETLRHRPYEQRIAIVPFQVNEALAVLQQYYHVEWMQHLFPYNSIQSADIVQEPRPAAENTVYRANFLRLGGGGYVRLWELTNTRFVLGLAGPLADALNQKFDPVHRRFRLHTAFTLEQANPSAPITLQTNTAGPFALLEFTGALPRARLYPAWHSTTNDQAILDTLISTNFEPRQMVLISGAAPPSNAGQTNQAAGTVEFVSYAPKRIQLKAKAPAPSILLLNDKHDPHWTVTVDGQPQPLLRCNYLMRGVQLPPGEHLVEFSFRLPGTALYISLAAILLGVVLLILLWREPTSSRPALAGPLLR